MNNLTMRGVQLVASAVLLMVANAGHAQFVWVDAKGVKQFSDRPPPQGTPQKNILKGRNIATASDPVAVPAPVPGAVVAVAVAVAAAAKAPPPSVAEREADYRKRKEEQAETEKKAAAEAETAKMKVAACSAARQSKAQLDTGAPIRDADANRSFLDDKQRAERNAQASKTINEHCG